MQWLFVPLIFVLGLIYNRKPLPVYCAKSVFTGDTHAQCFSISSNLFHKVYPDRVEGPVRGLNGYVFPGFWDSHGHLIEYGQTLHGLQLYGVDSVAKVRQMVTEFSDANPAYGSKSRWIQGMGWDQRFFDGKMPKSTDLPEDKYISLTRIDGHCVWVSPAVVKLLPPVVTAPPGGEIFGDGVFCDAAVDLILQHQPPRTQQETVNLVQTAAKSLLSLGIVGIHDAGVKMPDLMIYNELAARHMLGVRVVAMLECEKRNTYCGGTQFIKRGDGFLNMKTVKLFADGALGSWGASMLEPYDDHKDSTGTMLIQEANLKSLVKSYVDKQWQVAVHAIGDQANRAVIDAFMDIEDPRNEKRLRIEHAQIIAPEDQKRIAERGIIVAVQPTHATSDAAYAVSRLGTRRLAESAYKMKSWLETNATLALGSDFPIEPPNPIHGIYAAVKRLSPASGPGPQPFYPEEALNIKEAIRGFTIDAAYAGFVDYSAGNIKFGKYADFVVLDQDLFDPNVDLRTVKVLETWIGGKKVYSL